MVTPSKEKARLDAAKAAAKPAAPTPTVGGVPISVVPKAGQSYTPVATKTAPRHQTLPTVLAIHNM